MNADQHLLHSSSWKEQTQRTRYSILVRTFVDTENLAVLITFRAN